MKRVALTLMLSLFPLYGLAESPNEAVADAANFLDQELKARKEELRNNKEALYGAIDDIVLPTFYGKSAGQLVLVRHWRTARVARCSACLE